MLRVLLERLRNEITRLTAVKAFITIARSPLNVDLSTGKPGRCCVTMVTSAACPHARGPVGRSVVMMMS